MDHRDKLTGITDADYTTHGQAPKEDGMKQETRRICRRCASIMGETEGPLCIDCFRYDAKVLRAQLALCAAGPWRYDVVNAKSGPSYWVAYKFWGMGRELVAYDVCHMTENGWYKNDGSGLCEGVFAFAAINPPQEPTP